MKTFPLWITKASGEIWQRTYGECAPEKVIRLSSEIAEVIDRHSRKKNEQPCTIPPSLGRSSNFTEKLKEWWAYRIAKNGGRYLAEATASRHIAFFEKLGPMASIASIEQSISRGWTGLFEVKEDLKKVGQKSTPRIPAKAQDANGCFEK